MAVGERGEEGHTKTRRHEGGGEGGKAGLARGGEEGQDWREGREELAGPRWMGA